MTPTTEEIRFLHDRAVKAAQVYEAATPGTQTKRVKEAALERAEKAFLEALKKDMTPTPAQRRKHMQPAMSEDEKRQLKNFASVLGKFTDLRDNIPMSHLVMLLKLAQDEGKSQKYYSKKWGVPPATVSRIMLDFGKRLRKGQPGMGLIDERISAHSLREHEVYLSDEGRSILRESIKSVCK